MNIKKIKIGGELENLSLKDNIRVVFSEFW